MPWRNRVLPTGDFVHDPAYRGNFMGNRGILHDAEGALSHRRWAHKSWVTCRLSFKGRRQTLLQPGRYTQLFFHDEAVAFAAGHRPCAECRRKNYNAFRTAAGISGPISVLDDELHAQRAYPRIFRQRRHACDLATLPEGSFVLSDDGAPMLVLRDALLPFRPGGYSGPVKRPGSGRIKTLTPPLLLNALREGYALWLKLPD